MNSEPVLDFIRRNYGKRWFEKEPNPKNCSVRLIDEDGEDGGYIFPGFDKPKREA